MGDKQAQRPEDYEALAEECRRLAAENEKLKRELLPKPPKKVRELGSCSCLSCAISPLLPKPPKKVRELGAIRRWLEQDINSILVSVFVITVCVFLAVSIICTAVSIVCTWHLKVCR